MQFEDEHFVEQAYLMILKRKPDLDGSKYYLDRLRCGITKPQILDQLIRSREAKVAKTDIQGLNLALRNYRLTRLPILGGIFKLFLNVADESPISLKTLLNYQGNQFIEHAYKVLLKRLPDSEGLAYYLNHLNSGIPKIEILDQIRRSREAAVVSVNIPGLGSAVACYKLSQIPMIGCLIRLLFRVEGNSLFERRLRVIEQKVATAENDSTVHLHAIGQTLESLLAQITFIGECIDSGTNFSQQKNAQVELNADSKQPVTFFTICSKNFTAYAKTLFNSVKQHHPDSEMYLFLCDGVDSGYQTDILPFKTVTLMELDIPDVQKMSERYNITEFNTAIKPFAFEYLFKKLFKNTVVYVDPDILLTGPLNEVIDEFDKGAECILTPHILEPAENVEVSDVKMLLFGIYNLGFIGLRKTPGVIRIVEWWGRRLENDCVIDLQNGLFVDQKWADLLPSFITKTSILHHPGYNVAYWNLSQRVVRLIDGVWYSNQQLLRFVHFSGNKLDDPQIFSRHSGTITRENIGDLSALLDYYREMIFANGHAEYSKLPYSYNWNGSSGVNLHTPQPSQQQNSSSPVTVNVNKSLLDGSNNIRDFISESFNPSPIPKIFITDWSTPRPDQDAGSVTTYFLLKILVELGYDVTFVPSDLTYLSEYTDAVRGLGVKCLHKDDIGSVQEHLQIHGREYSAFILFRAPIAALYLHDIRKYAPNSKVVLETVDLHYLREERFALAEGSKEATKLANEAKTWELGIIKDCDVSIVLSSAEKELLAQELPESDIRVMPLLFLDMNKYSGSSFKERENIVFIGGFNHLPNVDAVLWFCKDIWPLVRKKLPRVRFMIVGSNPPDEILALDKVTGVKVLGHVKDIDPIFNSVRLSVAPLRYGAGIKGKIATSLGYGVPVVGTSLAFEGMELLSNVHSMIADEVNDFADAIVRLYCDSNFWKNLHKDGFQRAYELYSEYAGRVRIREFMKSLNLKTSDIEFFRFKSFEDYQRYKSHSGEIYRQRMIIEHDLINHNADSFYVDGYCAVCCEQSEFQVGFMYSYMQTADGKPIPNWREHLNCIKCGYTNRVRLVLHILNYIVRPQITSRIYITEQTTPLFKNLESRYSSLIGSEYLGDCVPWGEYYQGLRNEDLTCLTFPSESFDLIISCDVLEHVADDRAALSECFRCLAPGGTIVFTAPCRLDSPTNIVRAKMAADGSIEQLIHPPEYHGNPVDPENGALCFRDFGWEVLDQMKLIGFNEAYVISTWSRDLAYLGGEQIVFLATKSKNIG